MLYRVTEIEPQIVSGGTSARVVWKWGRTGYVRRLWFGTLSGLLVDRAGLGLAVYRLRRDVATDGKVEAFTPALAETGLDPLAGVWTPFLAEVEAHEPWALQLQNAGPNTVKPIVLFDFEATDEP